MDLTTLLGMLGSFGAILLGQHIEGGHIGSVAQPTAAIIVIGGTIGAVCVGFPGATLKATMTGLKHAFVNHPVNVDEKITLFVELAKKARRDGLVSIEREVGEIKDPNLKRGLEMAVDGTDAKALRTMLEIELTREEERGEGPVKVLEAFGGYAPTVGIIGAVLGLIHVMENLSDPSKLGSGIAVAFVATVYGVSLANLIFLPLATKVKVRHKEELLIMEMIIEGVCAIAEGEHPRLIEHKLNAYANKKGGGKDGKDGKDAGKDG